MKRLYRALVDALDLAGSDGRASFQKLVLAALLVLAACGVSVPTTLAIAIIAASFGRTTLLAFLARGSFSASSSDSRSRVEHEVTIRRDPELGIEATP